MRMDQQASDLCESCANAIVDEVRDLVMHRATESEVPS
jgi:hypothetical protein